jgi:hypothetical protein
MISNSSRLSRMSIRQIPTRIELGFWQIVIALMSESPSVQQLVRWLYSDLLPSAEKLVSKLNRRRLFRWSAGGLGMGLVIGFLTAIL